MHHFLLIALGASLLTPSLGKTNDFIHYKERCILAMHKLLIQAKDIASATQIEKKCHCIAKESVIKNKFVAPSWCPRGTVGYSGSIRCLK